MIEELEDNAKNELKRADHLIYVTLKYTRTADVIKNTVKRLISAFDFSILELLEFLKKKKKIKEIPSITKVRAEVIKEKMPDLKKEIDFYNLLRDIDKAEFKRREEYRKNVTLIAVKKPGENIEVDVDTLRKYFERTIDFVDTVEEIVRD